MEFLTLNNGVEMPSLGLGVFQSSPEDTADAVAEALRVGYRHIDTAAAYGNEKQVSEGVRRSGLARDEVFVETKVWVSDYGFEQTRHACEKASAQLGLDQIDLLILHQPAPLSFDSTLEAYRGLESLLDEGRVRAIGVSNFMVENLDALMERATVTPAVNQIEVHPYFQQRDVQAKDAELGIVTPGLVAAGRHHLLPRLGQRRSSLDPGRPDDRGQCEGARQEPCAGDVAVAPAGGTPGDPEVGEAPAHRGEPQRVRLPAHRRRDRLHRRARHRRARRP